MMNVKEQVTDSSQIFTMEGTAMLKKIQATYHLDDLDFNMLPILELIEDIICTSNKSSDSAEERPIFQYEVLGKMHQNLASTINVISCEILGSCNRYQDTNETVLSMFGALSTLSWIAKGVVALAAFAINYGEFRLLLEQHSTDSTAKLLSYLENTPKDFSQEYLYKEIANLAKAAVDLIKYLWRVKYLYANLISHKPPKKDPNAKLHIAVYWIIQSIVICQSIITNLANTGYESISSTAEQWELYYLCNKVKEFHQHIESETSEKLWSLFPQEDITVLKRVICSEDRMPMPMVDGVTKIPQKIDMLENKPVLLYISNLDPPNDEIEAVKQMHATHKDEFQFVWLPVLDKSEDWNELTYEKKRNLMPWLVVREPQLLDGTMVKFIENGWEFKKRSIIVAFDRCGKIVNKNALPMILIWGSKAHPFTNDKEAALWKSQTWRLELLLPLPEFTSESKDLEKINQWDQWIKKENNYICMYGGEDTEWIKRFEAKMEVIANALSIPSDNMKMLNLDSLSLAWITWARIEAIFFSRSKQGNKQSHDVIKEEALTMCSFHWSHRGWAIISKGSITAKALGNVMLNCLNKCKPEVTEEWKKNGLVESLNAYISKNCETLHFLPTFPEIPKMRVCSRSNCGRPMRKSVTFHCWGDHKTQSTNPTTES